MMAYELLFEKGAGLQHQNFNIVDGELLLFTGFLSESASESLYKELLQNSKWAKESIQMFGKIAEQPRLTYWYGKGLSAMSKYKTTISAGEWTPILKEVKTKVEKICDQEFNSVLINYYRNGDDCMGMHSDDEPIFGKNPTIASLSIGASRPIHFKHKEKKDLKLKIEQPNGSLLLMRGPIQHFWKHGINRSKKVFSGRINLTFRFVYD